MFLLESKTFYFSVKMSSVVQSCHLSPKSFVFAFKSPYKVQLSSPGVYLYSCKFEMHLKKKLGTVSFTSVCLEPSWLLINFQLRKALNSAPNHDSFLKKF